MAKVKIEMKCDKCNRPQLRDEAKSNENWNVYDPKQKCECGGKFAMYMNGEKI